MLNTEIKKKNSMKIKKQEKNTQHYTAQLNQLAHSLAMPLYFTFIIRILWTFKNEEQNEEIQKWNRT